MGDARSPCRVCKFPGLCHALDTLRAENAALRIEAARRDAPPIAARARTHQRIAADPLAAQAIPEDVRDLKARVAELEQALARTRAIADAEGRRADEARDALARSFRVALGVGARRALSQIRAAPLTFFRYSS